MLPEHTLLFEPYTFPSGLVVPNRIAIAPMTTWSGNPDGSVHDGEIAYLRRRSRGPGMVITAACYVMKEGYAFENQWACHDDAMLPSLRRASDTIHAEGAAAILQIHHGGRMCPASLLGHAPLSASAVPAARPDADTPRAMSEEEIHATIRAFGEATRRAVESGYDGVEIHGANTYLLQQFFSPHSNRRDDEWGGSLERRMRFPLAVLASVQQAAASASRPFAVGYRLSPEEIEEPGITMDDTLALVDALAALRPDWLHVSVREYLKGSLRDRSDTLRPTRRIIDAVGERVPVIGVGKVYTPEDAMFILEDGCPIVALGRILLMEPEWVTKVAALSPTDPDATGTIRVTLPAQGGAEELTIPGPMYRRLLAVKGWLPIADSER
jgi:2,4-dienoyl-CoA reductase-like NADH-dependent reductase (Old Yellow Enzyme family)